MYKKSCTCRCVLQTTFSQPFAHAVFSLPPLAAHLHLFSYLRSMKIKIALWNAAYQKMRGLSMDEVKRTNGKIDFEDVLLSERGV